MRYYVKQYCPLPPSVVDEDRAVEYAKERIAMKLLDMLPYKVEHGAFGDPDIISVELDVEITPWDEFMEMVKSYKNKEDVDLNNQ